MILGAPTETDGTGRVFVLFGQDENFPPQFDLSALDGSNGFVIRDLPENRGRFGNSVSTGDINGDGIHEVLVGAPSKSRDASASKAFVIYGRTSGFDAIVSSLDAGNVGFEIEDDSSQIVLESLVPDDTVITPGIDFSGTRGNPFASLDGVDVGNDRIAALWTGKIRIDSQVRTYSSQEVTMVRSCFWMASG